MRHPRTGRRLATIALGAVALVTAACGGDDGTPTVGPTTAPAARYPVTLSSPGGEVRLEERPSRIVSLSPTATEMLFAIGAGKQVIAVDDQSNYPAGVPKSDLSGYQPNVEAIAAKQPDLVVASGNANQMVEGLAKLKIPVLIQEPAKMLGHTYAQLEQLGMATDHRRASSDVVKRIQEAVEGFETAVADAPTRTYYHELDNHLFTATSKTFIGQLYSLAGLTNIADAADKDGSGYPQLSAEAIFQADPDFIFLADTKCCKESPETVAKRPGWSRLKAVKNGHVFTLDDDIASRWGPRVVELLAAIQEAVAAKAQKPAA